LSGVTQRLHFAFLAALGEVVVEHTDVGEKPLCVDLQLPNPPRLRVYAYSLVGGMGTVRPTEYKAVLRVAGQEVGAYGSFDHSSDRFVLVVGYRQDLDVYVLWDASLHPRFKNGGNIQVHANTVHSAAASGWATQRRSLTGGSGELVIACRSARLCEAINERIRWTGGVAEDEWLRLQS
jgi:hypothetical protein